MKRADDVLEPDPLEHEGDRTTGDEGDPGPTGSSTGLKAPRTPAEDRDDKEKSNARRQR